MKKILLFCALSLYVLVGISLYAASTADTTVAVAPAMDSNIENDLINQISSMQYASIDVRISTLDKIQLRAKSLGYISPAVQSSYYAAATKIFSDLMATSDTSYLKTIRRGIGVFTSSLSSQILDVNQKNLIRSYTAQLNQQYQALVNTAQRTTVRGQRTASQHRPARVR